MIQEGVYYLWLIILELEEEASSQGKVEKSLGLVRSQSSDENKTQS